MNRLVLNFFAKDLVPTYRPLRRAPSCQIASIRRTAGGDEFCRRRIWLGSELMADEISNPMTSSEAIRQLRSWWLPGGRFWQLEAHAVAARAPCPDPRRRRSRERLGSVPVSKAARVWPMLYSSAATTQRIKMRAWLYM